MVKAEVCMVRVGGGWEKIEDYLRRNEESEIEKIKRVMLEQKKSYKSVIVDYLTKYSAEP